MFRDARRVDAELTVLDVQIEGDVITAKVRSRIDVRLGDALTPARMDALSDATLVRDSTGWRLWGAPLTA
jgi:hypothetical protein